MGIGIDLLVFCFCLVFFPSFFQKRERGREGGRRRRMGFMVESRGGIRVLSKVLREEGGREGGSGIK